jgi:hypothetical protein
VPESWDPTELIGTKAGSCLLERLIGRGGASAVFLARQTRPQRNVAVKVLHPRLAPDTASWDIFLARFRREADAAAALDHANIVPVYAYGDEGDMAYLVMPYLPDGSLGDLVRREGPRTVATTIHYVEQAAAALDYAHRAGILHRDVKLTNLLLHPDGRVMLTDFGIARPLGLAAPAASESPGGIGNASLTQAGGIVGTPEYMAPEQMQGGKLGPTVDVYALATVAWALLGGHTPFGGGDKTEVVSRQIKAPPPPLRTLRPDVPPGLEAAIFGGLAKHPEDRPPTPGAFAQSLRAAAERSGVRVGRGTFAGSGLALASRGAGSPPGSEDTMMDAPAGGAPIWPMGEPPSDAPRGPRRNWLWPVLGLALVVVTVGATCMATANWLGLGLRGGPAGIIDVIPSPTATVTPTPTPTDTPVLDSWLVVSMSNIQLSCFLFNKMHIVLENQGAETVDWKVTQHGGGTLTESPNHGNLGPNDVVDVVVTVTRAKGNQSGELDFIPSNPQAGPPAVVKYNILGCSGG